MPSLPSTPRNVPSGHGTKSSILYLHSPGVRPKVIVRSSGHPLIRDSLTLRGLSWSCSAVVHPSSAAPTTEGSSRAGIRPPDCLSPHQIFPAAGSHENCITIINQADDLEDYTGPQERSHSFMSTYVMHRLILHATLLSCSPIRL